ncbi:MAG: PIN domain-containing protein [Elusimicrobiales bacterium]|nr:PIN domain-containing protein [Elusimicrobiales bacterium]
MHTSKKPAVYLIDGLNYVRSHLAQGGPGEEDSVSDFLDWLEYAAQYAPAGSFFRVVLDGGYRNVGATVRAGVRVDFSEGERADDIILEHALYLLRERRRPVVVSDDGELLSRARAEGVKTIRCEKFHAFCRSALPNK